jgi:hypothetical protein
MTLENGHEPQRYRHVGFPLLRLLPHATLHRHPGGYVDLVTNASEPAPVIETFLHTREQP